MSFAAFQTQMVFGNGFFIIRQFLSLQFAAAVLLVYFHFVLFTYLCLLFINLLKV